jgi:predicted metal-dependent peptidase
MSANATAAQAAPLEDAEPDLTPTGLTPQQQSAWQDTMSLMAWTCPGFRHLFYKLLSNNSGPNCAAVPTKGVPVAATNAKNIMINPDTFFKYPLKERVFIMAHEVVHNVYNDVPFLYRCAKSGTVPMHDGTTVPFRNQTMQKAMDYRINALLKESRIGSVPADCCLDDDIAKANESVIDVYKKVYEDEESGGHKTGPHNPFDQVIAVTSGGNPPSQNPQQWAVEIAAAQVLENMKAQGKGSGALQRMFEEILNPVVPWTDHIRGIFNRKVGSGSYNWRKPDRRFIGRDMYFPSRSGNGAGWIVVWGDTSGSIGQDELAKYLAELTSIVEDCQPQRLTVIWCDAEIKRIDEIAEPQDLDQVRYDGAPGGGGTDCQPVFDWIAEHTESPEVFIGFTDGFVDFPPQEPPFLCIWAMTTSKEAPFGDHVRINPRSDD